MKEVKPPRKPLFYYYGIALVVLLLINFLLVPLVARHAVQEVDYGTFMTMTENKEIGQVEVEDNQIIFTNKDGSKVYKTGPMNDPDLTQRLYDAGAEFTRDIVEETSPLLRFVLTWILPIIIFIALGQLMTKKLTDRAGGPGSMMFGAGKSNAKIYVQSSQGIRFADVAGEDAKAKAAALQGGQIMLLENLRFDPREEKNDPEFARELASMAELYVSDAFGTVHRAHASTAGVAAFLPAVSGLLVARELEIMGGALENPKRPFVAVLGGAKVSDKIGVINNLLEKANTIIIGGGMAYTFARAQGGSIGKSLCEPDKLDYALEMLRKAKDRGVQLLLPTDTVAAAEFSADADSLVVPPDAIPDDMEGLDIGPETIRTFCAAVRGAGTVVWNGPMGVFEFEKFAAGTRAMAQALADSGAVTIVGGGDSAAAVEQMGFADRITHISAGGGASLEFLEGIELPGVACLLDK